MRKKKQTKILTRLTSAETGKPMYIDLTEIIGVESDIYTQIYNPPPPSTSNNAVFITTSDNWILATRITSKEGSTFTVREHYLEVLALVEGRDPSPAQVMYGKHTNT